MNEAGTEKKSAILLDIENLVYGGLRDEATRLNVKELTATIVEHIEKIALFQHPITYRYAAISLTSKDGSIKIRKSREGVWSIVKTLSDMGYTVAVMPQSDNAADAALYEFGIRLKNNPAVAACIIGTGDGAGPLRTMVEELKDAGKNVHLVAYDYTPIATKIAEEASPQITTSIIAPQVHMSSEIAKEERVTPSTPPSLKALYRKAIQLLYEPHKKDGSVPSPQQERLECAISILTSEAQASKQRHVSLRSLMDTLKHDLKMLYHDITSEECETIVLALANETDLFEKSRSVQFNFKSNFLQKTKQEKVLA